MDLNGRFSYKTLKRRCTVKTRLIFASIIVCAILWAGEALATKLTGTPVSNGPSVEAESPAADLSKPSAELTRPAVDIIKPDTDVVKPMPDFQRPLREFKPMPMSERGPSANGPAKPANDSRGNTVLKQK